MNYIMEDSYYSFIFLLYVYCTIIYSLYYLKFESVIKVIIITLLFDIIFPLIICISVGVLISFYLS